MVYLIILFYFLLFFFVLNRFSFFKLEKISATMLNLALCAKLAASILLVLLYTYYYTNKETSDIYKYFEDGKIIHQLLVRYPSDFIHFLFNQTITNEDAKALISQVKYWNKTNSYGLFNDNRTIIIANAMLNFLSYSNILIQSIIVSFLSFIGCIALFKSISKFLENKQRLFFFCLFFFPSILLWTSGLLKETFVLMVLCGIVYFGIKSYELNSSFKTKVFFIIFCFLLFVAKPYFFIFLIPIFLSLFIARKIKRISFGRSFMLVYALVIFGSAALTTLINPVSYDVKSLPKKSEQKRIAYLTSQSYEKLINGKRINILESLKYKQKDNLYEARLEKAKSMIYIRKLDGSWLNLISALPFGFANALFRPTVFDISSIIITLPALDNLVLLLLILGCVVFYDKRNNVPVQFTLIVLLFSISILTFNGILNPVLGNLVRYKAPILPFILFLLIAHIDLQKIKLKFKR